MLPIVTWDPGAAGVHWLSASQVWVTFAGTVKVAEPESSHATTSGVVLSPNWQTFGWPLAPSVQE